jgi:hypothetical protein
MHLLLLLGASDLAQAAAGNRSNGDDDERMHQ